MTCYFILYVQDQRASTAFYAAVLDRAPELNLPGMTEFRLGPDVVLGLMPVSGIKRLLGDPLPDPTAGAGIPRVEIYLRVTDAARWARRNRSSRCSRRIWPARRTGWSTT